jgi:hypothetical protein
MIYSCPRNRCRLLFHLINTSIVVLGPIANQLIVIAILVIIVIIAR